MTYVNAFVVPVRKNALDRYRELARQSGKLWRELGALEYHEYIAEDAPNGQVTSFPQSVKLEPDETVVFGWIRFESRAQRDEVFAKAMEHPRMKELMNPETMPFDGKRMFFGGFEPLVEG